MKILEMSRSSLAMEIYTKCWRCNYAINGNSFFAAKLWALDEHLTYDIVRASELSRDDIAVHMSGDRECAKEVSGYHGKILKRLDLSMSCDTSFLDKL